MAHCGKCLHEDVCETAKTCDGFVPKCEHFMDKEEHPKLKHGTWVHLGGDEWCCSVCGLVVTTEGSWERPTKKYCSECGANLIVCNTGDW